MDCVDLLCLVVLARAARSDARGLKVLASMTGALGRERCVFMILARARIPGRDIPPARVIK